MVAVTILIHWILPIPIYIYRKREQKRDQEQQHQNPHGPSNQCNVFNDKHLGDLLYNYFIMFVIFCGYIVVTFLNRCEKLFNVFANKNEKNSSIFRTYPCHYWKYPKHVFFIHFVVPLLFLGVRPLMEFIRLLRSFRVHEIPIEPQNQSLECGNFPAAGHSQNVTKNQQEQSITIAEEPCKSKVIYVIPYNRGQ